jgi:hypothetical protein
MPHAPDVLSEETDLVQGQTGDLDKINDKPQESKIRRVLFFAANPSASEKIRHRDEFGFIYEKFGELSNTPLQLVFKLVSNVTSTDFMKAARNWRPHTIHFVGHGKEVESPDEDRDTQLIFHNDDFRELELIDSDKFSKMLEKLMKDGNVPLRIVFLNACSTSILAQKISKVKGGLQVVCSDSEITSDNARRFASEFYNSYCQDEDVLHAVEEGFWAIPDAESYIQVFQNGKNILPKNN